MRKYRLGFDVWGLILFLLIMLPNFVWFAIPAPHDILRGESTTPAIDFVASICQMFMIAALCLIKRQDAPKRSIHNKWILFCIASITIYFVCWIVYYVGCTNKYILLSLCLFPCLAFVAYEIDRKNWIAIFPTLGFTVLHLIYGILNFVI